MIYKNQKGTVLVFTLILVVLWVFMAMATLNLTQRLDYDLQLRHINNNLYDWIYNKASIIFQYARYLNSTWWGFSDEIGCPENISFSWSTFSTENVSSELFYVDNQILCQHELIVDWFLEPIPVQIYFNEDFDDTDYLDFNGIQIPFDNNNREGIVNSFEEIYIDGNASFPLQPDGIDDNLDSDNYMISSTWSILDYPEWYIDNDANHRIHNFWYIAPWDEWYNIFWSNQRTTEYIAWNTNNIEPIINLGDISEWYIYLDVNQWYDLKILRFDRQLYNEINELIILDDITINWASSWSWFIQSDASVIDTDIAEFSLSWDEYEFDFSNNDYALFIRNPWLDDILTYQLKMRDVSWEKVYFVPVQDFTESNITILSNHIVFSENWIPIGEQQEIIWRK